MPGYPTSIDFNEVEASAAVSANGESAVFNVEHAEAVEAYIIQTAGTTPDFDFRIETSPDGTNFAVVKTVANVTSDTGVTALSIARGTEAIGRFAKVTWIRNAGSSTFSVLAGDKA